MRNLILMVALLTGAYFWFGEGYQQVTSVGGEQQSLSGPSSFGRADSNKQAQGQGVVVKILPDDNKGSRHQKFIIRLSSGQTVLIAHNIDLAPRVSPLSVGDTVEFNGEYEWNEKGEAGWLKVRCGSPRDNQILTGHPECQPARLERAEVSHSPGTRTHTGQPVCVEPRISRRRGQIFETHRAGA